MALHNLNNDGGASSSAEDSPEDCFHDASEEMEIVVNNISRLHTISTTVCDRNAAALPTLLLPPSHENAISPSLSNSNFTTSPSSATSDDPTVDVELREDFRLHREIFERTPAKDISELLEQWLRRAPGKTMAEIVSVKDVHGNTPLHLAVMTGQKQTVQLLLNRDAPIKSRNAAGWTPLDEAISYGDRSLIRKLLKSGRKQARRSMQSRRPKLIEALSRIPDFEMDLRWEFYSWVPIVKRFLPSDTCTLSKRGSSIRLDTTLVDFSDRSWQRGNITFIFNGAKSGSCGGSGRKAHGGKALTVLDNELKVYQSVKYSGHSSDIEEDIDLLMSSDVIYPQISTKSISFTRAQAGWWFSRYNRTEKVGQFEADFYHINGLCMESKKRREHLSEEDVQSNRQLIESLKRSMDSKNGAGGSSASSPSDKMMMMDMEGLGDDLEEDEEVHINGEVINKANSDGQPKANSSAKSIKQGITSKKRTSKKDSKKKVNGSSNSMASSNSSCGSSLGGRSPTPNSGELLLGVPSSKSKKELAPDSASERSVSSADEEEDDEDDDEEEEEEAEEKHDNRKAEIALLKSKGSHSETNAAVLKAMEFRRRRSLPPPPPPAVPITWEAYISAPKGSPPCLSRPLKSKTSTRTFKATLAMSKDFPLSIESLLNVLEVVAPFKHFKKLNEFVRLNLPPGFPVKIDIPVIPAVLARVTFLNFTFKNDISEALFEIPADYTEDPSRFPDI